MKLIEAWALSQSAKKSALKETRVQELECCMMGITACFEEILTSCCFSVKVSTVSVCG